MHKTCTNTHLQRRSNIEKTSANTKQFEKRREIQYEKPQKPQSFYFHKRKSHNFHSEIVVIAEKMFKR